MAGRGPNGCQRRDMKAAERNSKTRGEGYGAIANVTEFFFLVVIYGAAISSKQVEACK
jgi:hypothetical protein